MVHDVKYFAKTIPVVFVSFMNYPNLDVCYVSGEIPWTVGTRGCDAQRLHHAVSEIRSRLTSHNTLPTLKLWKACSDLVPGSLRSCTGSPQSTGRYVSHSVQDPAESRQPTGGHLVDWLCPSLLKPVAT